jgi:hypothetical protein
VPLKKFKKQRDDLGWKNEIKISPWQKSGIIGLIVE